eukprot:TRINITY_DN1311_c0_g1_i4.p1 TRINITY_DN1311_c0_g1~~TRINITY_DN1311_c0_g1_i4.p1  ORF type:complete len:125 (-),score=30.40 TRINITY_DN1311_c0_g1_i4:165-539(-)
MCIRDSGINAEYMGIIKTVKRTQMISQMPNARYNKAFGFVFIVTLIAFAGLLVFLGIPDDVTMVPANNEAVTPVHLRISKGNLGVCKHDCLKQYADIYGPSWVKENSEDFSKDCTRRCSRRKHH